MRSWSAALILLAVASFALAAITIRNISEWSFRAAASPVLKIGNSSLPPLSVASWRSYHGLNVTTYRLCFAPGWEEGYTVGGLSTKVSGLSAQLCREEQSGAASYWISLGGVLQISGAQACGGPVKLPAVLSWRSIATGEYWVLASARFAVAGAEVQQFVNFSAKPMSLVSSASYSCTWYTRSDDFSGSCTPTQYAFNVSIPNNRTYVTGGSSVSIDTGTGNPSPSLHTLSQAGFAAFFIDHSSSPFSAATSFAFEYLLLASVRDDDYIQVNFFVDLNGDTAPDLEVIYYGSGGGTSPPSLGSVFYGRSLPVTSRVIPGFRTDQNVWISINIPQVHSTGRVVGLALAAYSRRGLLKIWWDNVGFAKCVLPAYLGAFARGGGHTLVYIDGVRSPSAPPSLVTEVDAYRATGNLSEDYGVAAAVYDVTRWGSVAAGGFSFSVMGFYLRNATDARNNVAYVSVGVDADGNGAADVEYFFYRFDVAAGALGVIVSVHVNPGQVVCTVSSGGACTPAAPSFKVFNLGTMSSGQMLMWNGSLPLTQEGTVVRVAFAVVDASGSADCTADDFWVWWDNIAVTFYACTQLPPGWQVAGNVFYRSLVPQAVAYVGSFSGDGGFYALDSSLSALFGVRRSGSTYYFRCGTTETVLGSYPGANWVDLRLLSGAWEAILRDPSGGILTRSTCAPAGMPSYVGFAGVYSFEFRAWGCDA